MKHTHDLKRREIYSVNSLNVVLKVYSLFERWRWINNGNVSVFVWSNFSVILEVIWHMTQTVNDVYSRVKWDFKGLKFFKQFMFMLNFMWIQIIIIIIIYWRLKCCVPLINLNCCRKMITHTERVAGCDWIILAFSLLRICLPSSCAFFSNVTSTVPSEMRRNTDAEHVHSFISFIKSHWNILEQIALWWILNVF